MGLIPVSETASMRPRLFSGERELIFCWPICDKLASMRPRLFSGERPVPISATNGVQYASMRPRLFSGERAVPIGFADFTDTCFNEAPLIQRGKGNA